MINGYTMSGQPVPSRENHRDSRAAKVELKIGTAKPRAGKFSTAFSTVKEQIAATNIPVRNSNFRECFITCLPSFPLICFAS